MPSLVETVEAVEAAPTWDQRVARLRSIPQHHGIGDHAALYAAIAKSLYLPHLAPDYAYIHEAPFYERPYFEEVYAVAESATDGFRNVDAPALAAAIGGDPRTLLIFRTIVGLTKDEFAHSTTLAAEPLGLSGLSNSKVDSMEKRGTAVNDDQALVAAQTLAQVMAGTLFGDPPGDVKSKQSKPDTTGGWPTVRSLATAGVPYSMFLHQRHYGGAFRQVLDATSTRRGNIIEDALEALFVENGIPHIRTGSHNQDEIRRRFEVQVTPAPDFVVFDGSSTLRALLECKGANDGGTARDKALRFERLRAESVRLGGVPLLGVLGGLGWTRTNDTLGPVVRDTDGRVFTLATLDQMLTVAPFPSLLGVALLPGQPA